ncbi:MAG: integration host factor subunit alpha [Labilithrix sp.]|nr:integration host factor subunit alpha [Labilithrix sp.]MBX3223082.1 integration host factor subunit alpha [Labilithrix sp.]
MTKAEIVQALYTRVGGFSKKESADIVDMVFEMMKETLGRGEKIKISGFGNFVLRDKRQRPGRNPQTGDPIKISERRVLTFKASQILKQALNPRTGNGAHDDLIEDEPDEDEDESDVAVAVPVAAPPAGAPAASAPIAAPAPVASASVPNEAPKE